ncbi:MAG: ArsR/SmtB family transcription factor [Candidatus Bathyarchaeia archaeon]
MGKVQTRRQTRISDKRLERLVCSGLRPTKNLEDYAVELRQLVDKLVDLDFLREQADLLKALANETRLHILMLLRVKEMCVCELTVALDLTQPTASHHLNILQNVGLVKDRKEGKWVFYRIAKPKLIQSLFDILEFPNQ